MNIRWEQPTEPPRVRYGDLPDGAVYRHADGEFEAWLKGDTDDVALDDGCVTVFQPERHTLVIPLDAELVIRGYAGQSVPLGKLRGELISEAKIDALRRERDVLRACLDGMQGSPELTSQARANAARALLEADRIRREAEGGEA